jgi:DNA-binding NarL/FixJ family response regulator
MKILIAHADGLVLGGVRQALTADGGFDVVGEVHHSDAVLPQVGALGPGVVLLDIDIPGAGGLAILSELRARYSEVKVVMSSMSADRTLIEAALAGGACGYIVEKITVGDLPSAIRQAGNSTARVPSLAAPAHLNGNGPGPLTSREADVLEAVARGLPNKAIAAELRVTVQTVKFHLTSIYRKLRVTNRTEAARWALRNGITD